jgi:hypothetical protein
MLRKFSPRYFINHATDQNIRMANKNGYDVKEAWHAINKYGYATWVLYERNVAKETKLIRLSSEQLIAGAQTNTTQDAHVFSGKEVSFDVSDVRDGRVLLAIENPRGYEQTVHIQIGDWIAEKILECNKPFVKGKSFIKIDEVVSFSEGPTISIKGDGIIVYDPLVSVSKR